MALALCAVLAVPARWRPAAATAGGLFALGVAYAILALGWHFPSDVIGGYLVAGAVDVAGGRRGLALGRAAAGPRRAQAALGAGRRGARGCSSARRCWARC